MSTEQIVWAGSGFSSDIKISVTQAAEVPANIKSLFSEGLAMHPDWTDKLRTNLVHTGWHFWEISHPGPTYLLTFVRKHGNDITDSGLEAALSYQQIKPELSIALRQLALAEQVVNVFLPSVRDLTATMFSLFSEGDYSGDSQIPKSGHEQLSYLNSANLKLISCVDEIRQLASEATEISANSNNPSNLTSMYPYNIFELRQYNPNLLSSYFISQPSWAEVENVLANKAVSRQVHVSRMVANLLDYITSITTAVETIPARDLQEDFMQIQSAIRKATRLGIKLPPEGNDGLSDYNILQGYLGYLAKLDIDIQELLEVILGDIAG